MRPAYGAKGAGSNVGVMFLCEAALGKEASITVDDHRLTAPPKVRTSRAVEIDRVTDHVTDHATDHFGRSLG